MSSLSSLIWTPLAQKLKHKRERKRTTMVQNWLHFYPQVFNCLHDHQSLESERITWTVRRASSTPQLFELSNHVLECRTKTKGQCTYHAIEHSHSKTCY